MWIYPLSRFHPVRWAGLLLLVASIAACGVIPSAPVPEVTPTHTISAPTTTVVPAALPAATGLDPEDWMTWPVAPIVTRHVREIYTLGQSMGNDPHAFSVFGDCQSEPDVFLGPYVTDPTAFASLSSDLKQTADYFKGSLDRESPTTRQGTTSGALLWNAWHENKYGCRADESPMDCELRLHKPSFVLIMVGTHSEGERNEFYMRKVLEALLARGVVPILSTKADNREGDNHLNLETAQLAAEYNLPLWNFWPVTSDLPNRGLYTKEIDLQLGDIYLTEEALARHRQSALQVLDTVRRAVTGE
jgi:hypothetical protein